MTGVCVVGVVIFTGALFPTEMENNQRIQALQKKVCFILKLSAPNFNW